MEFYLVFVYHFLTTSVILISCKYEMLSKTDFTCLYIILGFCHDMNNFR